MSKCGIGLEPLINFKVANLISPIKVEKQKKIFIYIWIYWVPSAALRDACFARSPKK